MGGTNRRPIQFSVSSSLSKSGCYCGHPGHCRGGGEGLELDDLLQLVAQYLNFFPKCFLVSSQVSHDYGVLILGEVEAVVEVSLVRVVEPSRSESVVEYRRAQHGFNVGDGKGARRPAAVEHTHGCIVAFGRIARAFRSQTHEGLEFGFGEVKEDILNAWCLRIKQFPAQDSVDA